MQVIPPVSGNKIRLSKRRRLSSREGGQMAVFIALIFQVLFVIFAMAINIGLVVHDKINLQNAVDLAAYYAAQRQAEWLNVMAHQNYQIRQSFKLMAWRYRVLGTMGLDTHPVKTGQIADAPFPAAVRPVACLSYQPVWVNVRPDDSICKNQQLNIPAITVAPVIAGFNPINAAYAGFARAMQNQINTQCRQYGGFNYFYTNLIKFAYRQDQWRLKQSILTIARNLALPGGDMIDLNGSRVGVGARKTFEKNLTFENLQTIEEFKMYNSMEGLQPEQWLNEMRIAVNMYYQDVLTGSGCNGQFRAAENLPQNNDGLNFLSGTFGKTPQELASDFADPDPANPARMSLGFEKNPWYKLYVGVRAKTRPRQIFFPFGDPVQFEAVAYATPFGGRMGPWYKDRWPRGGASSDGAEIDELLPPLVVNQAGGVDPQQADRLLPNYARFPGDNMGLISALSQSALAAQLNMRSSINYLAGVFDQGAGKTTDILVWAGAPDVPAGSMRKYEVAAVAPDLFDMTYYSIEPNYGRTYLPKLRAVMPALGLGNEFIPRLDLGGRDDNEQIKDFSVMDQMKLVGATLDGTSSEPQLQRPDAYWFARDRAHILTSWVHNDVIAKFDGFPDNRYGRCGEWDDQYKHKIPGSCLFNGGRTGYSVKIINGDFLRSDGVQYGGANQRGSLLNPPPDTW